MKRALRLLVALTVLTPLVAAPLAAQSTDAPSSGRIESTAVAGSCGASLLRPDLLITAAHCVRPDRDWYIFRPGDGDFPGLTHPIGTITRHPTYLAQPRSLERQRYDIALARLTKPIPRTRLRPIQIGPAAEIGEALVLESWRQDGTRAPARRDCAVIEPIAGHVTLDCPVSVGDSGSAVLRITSQGAELVAIVTTRHLFDGRTVTLATNLADHAGFLAPARQP